MPVHNRSNSHEDETVKDGAAAEADRRHRADNDHRIKAYRQRVGKAARPCGDKVMNMGSGVVAIVAVVFLIGPALSFSLTNTDKVIISVAVI